MAELFVHGSPLRNLAGNPHFRRDLSHRSACRPASQIISLLKRSGRVMECTCISNLGTWAETDAHLDRVCSLRSARSVLVAPVVRRPQKGC
jgi:hypothetical protein